MKYKKIIVSAVLLCSANNLLAQNESFAVTGKLSKVKDGAKIYLISYGEAKAKKDSAFVQNGYFTFNGSIGSPCVAQLYLPNNPKITKFSLPLRGDLDYRNFYLDRGNIILEGTDSVKSLKITGSKINEEDERLTKILYYNQNKITAFQNAYQLVSPDRRKDSTYQKFIYSELEKLQDKINDAKMAFAVDNPDSYVGLNAVFEVARSRSADYYRVNAIYKLLTARYKNTSLAKETEALIAIGLNTTLGASAPDFTQPDVDGKPHKLSDFRGKYVLFELWSSWCGPCRKESPNLVEAYKKYSTKNFTIVAVSWDIDKSKWLDAIEKDKLPYIQLSDLKGPRLNEASKLYGTQAIPENYLINPDGKIIAKNIRGEDLQNMLKNLFE